MAKKQTEPQYFDILVHELVPGGQAIGELPDGRKVFVWNALPGENVHARLIKSKRHYAEAIAEEVLEPSADRIAAKEDNYLATSPWQVLKFDAENRYKNNIVRMQAEQAKVRVDVHPETGSDGREWHYRNKMEYSFWGDDDGIHLALHKRGSHGKQIVSGSALAMPHLDVAANTVVAQLTELGVRAGDLKTIVVRGSQDGTVVAALFVKHEALPKLTLPAELAGLRVYYSNPKSPASVPTKLLYELGSLELEDTIGNATLHYDVDSFFQVNVPVFTQGLQAIGRAVPSGPFVDMYAGVGSIGLSLGEREVTLVELDPSSVAMARQNAGTVDTSATVVEASTEQALEYITGEIPVVFDPPRAGLHPRVVERVLEVRPPVIAYLSCNPATQMRDLAMLQETYDIEPIQVYNFFPHTPHIETLAILRLKHATSHRH